ncbi:MAG: hypothetical protein GY749_30380 [Desulfobacteraceae bacterium]|nr:hypothetical protein [Desulfobacteraceae bacterium]
MTQVDFIGRIQNFHLPKNKPLLPLFEAAMNSFQAVEECPQNKKGRIEIHIHRDSQQYFDNSDKTITGFTIVDNGVGFNEENYKSFQLSDSRLKKQKGGKGIGRFTWLKMFSRVNIESTYRENGKFKTRQFDFLNKNEPINNEKCYPAKKKKLETKVTLYPILPGFKKRLPKDAESVAYRILEHFLIYFSSDKCPRFIIFDENGKIDLNELFDNIIKPFSSSDIFQFGVDEFNIDYFKLYSDNSTGHKLYFCAHRREVKNMNLSNHINSLPKKYLIDDKNGRYFFVAYISSEFLDNHVNNERTSFNIAEEDDEQLKIDPSDISFSSLSVKAIEMIKKQLKEDLKKSEQEKFKSIEYYIEHNNPKYRQLLKYGREFLKKSLLVCLMTN